MSPEVLTNGGSSAVLARLRRRWAGSRPGAWASRHGTAVNRALVGLAVLVVAGGVVLSHRPPPLAPLSSAPLTGVAIEVTTMAPVGPAGSGVRPIVATYHLATEDPDRRFTVAGVTGPFVRQSSVRSMPAATEPYDAVTVTATPDCTSVASLDPGPAPYELAVTERDRHGRTAQGPLRLTDPPVDWDSAVRRDCWQAFAERNLVVESVQATARRGVRRVDLDVLLQNKSARSVRVGVLDIADVATLDPADTGVVGARAERSFRVRLPIRDCGSPVLPLTTVDAGRGEGGAADREIARVPALAWSVGPVDADPLAMVKTGLSSQQASVVRDEVLRLCEPPGTTISVTAASALPSPSVRLDPGAISIGVRLSIDSRAEKLVVGDDQTALTADARVPTTQAVVIVQQHRGRTTIVWHPSCADRTPPVLPVRLAAVADSGVYAVVLRDPNLAAAYARACGLHDPGVLSAAGWRRP